MYVPAHFALTPAELDEALHAAGFAHLVTPTADGLVSTPLPLIYDPARHVLLGHVARNNAHWRAVATGESLAIVAGPDAYVSPGFYPSTVEHGRVVPTWNYEVLHVHGTLTAHDDIAWLRALVTRLTDVYESSRTRPWRVEDAPAEFLDGQLRAIIGLELSVGRVEAKAKLSQNRTDADRLGVLDGLALSGRPVDRAVAARMRAAD